MIVAFSFCRYSVKLANSSDSELGGKFHESCRLLFCNCVIKFLALCIILLIVVRLTAIFVYSAC